MPDRISQWWCKTMHTRAMWPIHGRYLCPTCGRVYRVAWEAIPRSSEYAVSLEDRRKRGSPLGWSWRSLWRGSPVRNFLLRSFSFRNAPVRHSSRHTEAL